MLPKKIESIYEEIKTKILNGFYQPGQALGEIPLATEYGINRDTDSTNFSSFGKGDFGRKNSKSGDFCQVNYGQGSAGYF